MRLETEDSYRECDFLFDNGNPTCLGYADDEKDSWAGRNDRSQDLSMQMLFSSEGFEAITLESRPLRQGTGFPMTEDCVFAQIPLRHLRGLMVGLDVSFPLNRIPCD